jgi:hypothetical protein
MPFPIDKQFPMYWRCEESPDRIAFVSGHLLIIAKDDAGCFVPGHHIPSSSCHKGWIETLMIEEVL